uniref:Uncharacterized protein n=1 Tax=Anguilla anguilla TaxID=7936 RepID=A0A0E9WTK3_ANGAN
MYSPWVQQHHSALTCTVLDLRNKNNLKLTKIVISELMLLNKYTLI